MITQQHLINVVFLYNINTMKKLYSKLSDLETKCDDYMQEFSHEHIDTPVPLVSPRHFRIYIGVSKSLLSKWRISKPTYFNLIKKYEDKILSILEQAVIRLSYTTDKEHKFNPVGIIFILRAYDREQYIPPVPIQQQVITTDTDHITIAPTNTSKNKVKALEVLVKEKK